MGLTPSARPHLWEHTEGPALWWVMPGAGHGLSQGAPQRWKYPLGRSPTVPPNPTRRKPTRPTWPRGFSQQAEQCNLPLEAAPPHLRPRTGMRVGTRGCVLLSL